MTITDFDDAYQNAAYIPEADRFLLEWAEKSEAFRAKHPFQTLQYGTGPRQFFDLFTPKDGGQGLTVIIHGGYWLRFECRDFSHLAAGALARGQAVAMINYTLAPEARISQIVEEVTRAICLVADQVGGPIHITGHSAGGHLATRMICEDALPKHVADRIMHVLSISGVHDLRPLLNTLMRDTLRLDPEEASAESPALLTPRKGTRMTAVVGGEERPEFLRQTDLLANIWTGLGADTAALHLKGLHHFNVIEGLETADGPLTTLLLAEV